MFVCLCGYSHDTRVLNIYNDFFPILNTRHCSKILKKQLLEIDFGCAFEQSPCYT